MDDGSSLAAVTRVDERNVASFTQMVLTHWRDLQRLVSRAVSWPDSQDVVQDTLTAAWRRWQSFDANRGSARSWLLAIAHEQARLTLRRKRRRKGGYDATWGRSSSTVEGTRGDELLAAMSKLPLRQREAINLYYFVGLSVAEVAQVMGCRDGTVKATLSAARGNIRKILEGGNDNDQ